MADDVVEVVGMINDRRSTEKAFCVEDMRDEFADKIVWLPKSQVEVSYYMPDGRAVMLVPKWLWDKKEQGE